jgi:hypothetical protein
MFDSALLLLSFLSLTFTMSFPSTFAILRGAFIDAKSPAGINGYEKPEYLVIMNAVKDTTDPTRPFYRVTRSNGGDAHLDKNWPAKVGVSSCRIARGEGVTINGNPHPSVKTKYCLLPLNVTFFQSNGMVDSCPVLSFERIFWMDRPDKDMAHLSHRDEGTEVIPTSVLWQSWTRAKMPLPAAIKAAKDAFDGRCSKEEAVRRINAAYNDFTAGLGGAAVVPDLRMSVIERVLDLRMSVIERVRRLNLPEVALRRMNADLPAVRNFLSTHSHLVTTPWFVAECSRIGNRVLIHHIRNLVFSIEHPTNIAKKIVNDYACDILGYASGTFDVPYPRLELNAVSIMFQDHCLEFVNRALEEILHAYRLNQRHQQSQRDSEAFYAAQRHEATEAEPARQAEPDADEEDAWYRERQEEDERIEDYIEENRQEMAERNESQMEAEEAELAAAAAADGADSRLAADEADAREAYERIRPDVDDAAHDLRTAQVVYNRLRSEARLKRDATLARHVGMWLKVPTGDGRTIERIHDELATEVEVRSGTDGCPWPYFVYENHVRAEVAKGLECPITMTPLSSLKHVHVSMNCGHIYDPKAIVAWTNVTGAENATCPTCRAHIAGMWQIRTKPMNDDAAGSDSA